MFYPELLEISKSGTKILSDELIEEIDIWLATLPSSLVDKITVSRFSTRFGIDYQLARSILERLCELKLLERLYAILCPECGHVLKVTDERNLLESMASLSFCYSCNEDINVDSKDIEIRYKLVKKSNDPDKIKKLSENILGKKSVNPQDRIDALIKEGNYNVNNLFYNPTEEEYKLLENLFCGVSKKHKTTTEKGNSLEELVLALLNTIKTVRATGARTSTNQIDCYVINKAKIPCTIFEKIGDIIYCECKNEKEKPDNNYFHKLNDIIILSRANVNEYRLGIVFSKLECTSTCERIAQKSYDKQNIYLINFSLSEIEEIIYKRINFLDYLRLKMDVLEHDLIISEGIKTAYLY
ncbi:MAG: hypothetical protein E7211_08820 [Clostridium lundense]|nr:hypothetical protein [Clostridium lundense]